MPHHAVNIESERQNEKKYDLQSGAKSYGEFA
jgi:hypothetical protein